MGNIVENVRAICKAKGIPVSKLEADLGYGNGYLNPKKIKTLTMDRVEEIMKYLDVSLASLMGEIENAPTDKGERKATDAEIKAAFWGGDEDLPEDEIDALWEDAKSYIAFKTEQAKKKRRK